MPSLQNQDAPSHPAPYFSLCLSQIYTVGNGALLHSFNNPLSHRLCLVSCIHLDKLPSAFSVLFSLSTVNHISTFPSPRAPYFHPGVFCTDDLTANNKTAETISKRSLKLAPPVKRRGRLNSRVGKHSYITQNVFEQELYFGGSN